MTQSQTRPPDPGLGPRNLASFLGRKVIFWLLLTVAGSLILALSEFGIVAFLQLFLKLIGAQAFDVKLPAFLGFAGESIAAACGMLLGVGIVRAIGQILTLQGSIQAQEGVNSRLRHVAVYEMLLDPSQRFVSAAEMNARLGELFPKAAQFSNYAAQALSQALQMVVLSLFMLSYAWREAAVGLAGLVVIGLATHTVNRKVRARASVIPLQHRTLMQTVQRVARNWLLIKILRTQVREREHCAAAIDGYRRASLGATLLTNLTAVAAPAFGIALIVVIVILSRNVFGTAGMSLVAFLYFFVRFVQNVATFVAALGICNVLWPQFAASARFLLRFSGKQRALALRSDEASAAAAVSAATFGDAASMRSPHPPSITCRDLVFTYPGVSEPVIDRRSFSVLPGTQFGIVGPSGCGKSTLLSLILGVLEPDSGTIELAGISPQAFLSSSNGRVGYVGAEPFLVEGSISDNLSYGSSFHFTEQSLWLALEQAKLAEVVASLPEQLSFRLTENGEGLSAGQKQRLCLARAFLSQPDVLVLDEASANLDLGTEGQIAESLLSLKGQSTVIIVSHRSGLLKYADQVLNMSP